MVKVIHVILILLILARPVAEVYGRREIFFSRGFMAVFPLYENAYYSSQYVKKKNPGIIPDDTFEAFVGGAFLRGVNPILIVHEHPPMGRYIIALSILLFDNPRTLIIPLLALSFFGLFLILRKVLNNNLLALLPLVVYANEPLTISKFQYVPLLEPIQLPFIIFALYFFIQGVSQKRYVPWLFLTSIMLGFVISIRFFILGAVLMLAMITYLVLQRKERIRLLVFVASLPLSLVVLFGSYFRTIQDGYSLFQILGVQKYILFYHQSKLENLFSFWDLLLFNRWHAWWGERIIISDSTWVIAWPIATVLTTGFVLLFLLKKIKINSAGKIILLWILAYSLLLSGGNSTTRYFLPLLPFLYTFATAFLVVLFRKLA